MKKKKKFSDRNDKIVKGVKRFFRRFVIWIKNNKKVEAKHFKDIKTIDDLMMVIGKENFED